MRRQLEPMVFLSAFILGEKRFFNECRHQVLKRKLLAQDLIECVGVYKGTMEMSLGIVLGHPKHQATHIDMLLGIAKSGKQESIMLRDELGRCYLIYTSDGRREFIGKWTSVPTLEAAEKYDGYTYAKVQGEHRYFVAA